MLIFSLFNLTAPPNPERAMASFNLGVVNHDKGLIFPPIKFANRVLGGLGDTLPFSVTEFHERDGARAALEAGEVAAVILFQPEFSKMAVSEENFETEIWNGQHLTVAETQASAQLPMMIQMAMSAGVANLRLALAKGRIPSGGFPVTAKVETLHPVSTTTKLVVPFVMTFTNWLAAFVGAMLLFLATGSLKEGFDRARLRSAVPVVSTGIASLVLALVIGATTWDWALLLPVWLNVWFVTLCLNWFMSGLFAVFGLVSILIILPAAFYQTALGGAMAPVAAAPEWLASIGEVIPFYLIGAAYRGVVLGGSNGLPLVWLGASALVGLVLIWAAAALRGRKADA